MVVTMANVAAPASAKANTKHTGNLAENSSQVIRTSSAVPRPVYPGRTKAVTERSYQPREDELPVIRPLVIRKVAASKQTRIPAPVSYSGSVRPIPENDPRKPVLNKALPSKPMFRPADSPERRGVIDATDMNSRNLDIRFPPLEPTNSAGTSNSAHLSPAADSFVITPSLLSSDQSGGSRDPEFIEYGSVRSEQNPAGYSLNAPGPLDQKPLRQGHQENDGSPSRSSRRTSKYGVTIRESLDAREIIMGGREDQNVGTSGIVRRPSRFGSVNSSGSHRVHNAPAETPIPPVPEIPASFIAMSPRPSPHVSRKSSLPIRSNFSEVKDSKYATKAKNNVADAIAASGTCKSQEGTRASNTPPVLTSPKQPRQSLFARQTTSRAARESATFTKDSKAGGLATEVSQFRSVSSLSNVSLTNVGNGMKKLGRKVANIIPSHRAAKSIAASASMVTSKATKSEVSESTSNPSNGLKTSRILTTYKSNDMNNNTSVTDGSSICPGAIGGEPTDKHVTNEMICDKEDWELAEEGHVYDGDRLVYFGAPPNRRGAPIGAGDDDEPPDTPPIRDNLNGHYVERTDEERTDEEEPTSPPTPTATGVDEPVNQLTLASALHESNSAVPPNSPASPVGTGNEGVDSAAAATTAVAAVTNFPTGLNQVLTGELAHVLEDADLVVRGLIAQALNLEPSPLRTQITLAAERLGELVINLREARIMSMRINQSLDELSTTVANGGVRLSTLVEAYLAERG